MFKKDTNIQIYQRAYRKSYQTMMKALDLTEEINAYNRLYSKYITFTIINFSICGCSVANAIVQKIDEAPLLQVIPWIFFDCIFLGFVYLFCVFSSRTIYLNVQLFKRLRLVQIKLLSEKRLLPVQTIKLDLVNEYKVLLQKSTFHLWKSSTINNKLFFFQLFGYISVFYMKLLWKNRVKSSLTYHVKIA